MGCNCDTVGHCSCYQRFMWAWGSVLAVLLPGSAMREKSFGALLLRLWPSETALGCQSLCYTVYIHSSVSSFQIRNLANSIRFSFFQCTWCCILSCSGLLAVGCCSRKKQRVPQCRC